MSSDDDSPAIIKGSNDSSSDDDIMETIPEISPEEGVTLVAKRMLKEIDDCFGPLDILNNTIISLRKRFDKIEKPSQDATKLMTSAEKHCVSKSEMLNKLNEDIKALLEIFSKTPKKETKRTTSKKNTKSTTPKKGTKSTPKKETPKVDESDASDFDEKEKEAKIKENIAVHQKNEQFFQDVMSLLTKFTSELKSMLLTHLELKEDKKEEKQESSSDDDN